MTLIEVLVALTLMSMLSVGLLMAFHLGQRTYRQVTAADQASSDILRTQRLLRTVIEQAYPFAQASEMSSEAHGLDGLLEQLSVTGPPTRGSGATGHRRYRVFLTVEKGSSSLAVSATLDRLGSAPSKTSSSEVLLAGVARVEWSYMDSGTAEWRSSWSERQLPALVKLHVTFKTGDARKWPDLVVAPRVTDDARCEFDSVSQGCRMLAL